LYGAESVLLMMKGDPLVAANEATLRAREWLVRASVPTEEAASLRQLGILLCERIENGAGGPVDGGADPVQLPALGTLVHMSRNDVLALCGRISVCPQDTSFREKAHQRHWSQAFGGLALSYARVGDLSVVAALVRAAARLRLVHPWLVEAETYLLDQQQPDGSFGLFASELALFQDARAGPIALRLTVEVLWALAEATQNRKFPVHLGERSPTTP
jgi:hypothetical protein